LPWKSLILKIVISVVADFSALSVLAQAASNIAAIDMLINFNFCIRYILALKRIRPATSVLVAGLNQVCVVSF